MPLQLPRYHETPLSWAPCQGSSVVPFYIGAPCKVLNNSGVFMIGSGFVLVGLPGHPSRLGCLITATGHQETAQPSEETARASGKVFLWKLLEFFVLRFV